MSVVIIRISIVEASQEISTRFEGNKLVNKKTHRI